jgi:hypothetical protein
VADWISAAALVVSIGAAAFAYLSYRQADRFRRDAYYGEVAAFAAAIRRKTVLEAPDTSRWDASGVHESVRELRDDLTDRIAKLPREMVPTGQAVVESCARLLAEMRPWALDPNRARTDIQQIPEAHAIVTNWVAEVRAELARLDGFSEPSVR